MKFTIQLLQYLILCFGIAKNCAEQAQEIGNDMALPSDNPSQLEKQDFGRNETLAPSSFWPGKSFMKRILSALLPPVKVQPQPTQETPLIMRRFRFFLYGNNATQLLPADATKGETDVATKTEVSSSPPVSTVKMSKSSRRKRNKEEGTKQLTKAWPMIFYVNITEPYPVGKDGFKKPTKHGVKWLRMNDISYNFNKASSAKEPFYRRLLTHIVTMDWSSWFVHLAILIVFCICFDFILECCRHFTNYNPLQVAVKRFKVIPKNSDKFKTLDDSSIC